MKPLEKTSWDLTAGETAYNSVQTFEPFQDWNQHFFENIS